MSDHDDFLAWVKTLYEAELALHNGDARRERRKELIKLGLPVRIPPRTWVSDVIGDMAYTAGFEHTSASVNGEPRTYTLRATPGLSTRGRRVEGGPPPWRHRYRMTVACIIRAH